MKRHLVEWRVQLPPHIFLKKSVDRASRSTSLATFFDFAPASRI
jgi:hypothetical protein